MTQGAIGRSIKQKRLPIAADFLNFSCIPLTAVLQVRYCPTKQADGGARSFPNESMGEQGEDGVPVTHGPNWSGGGSSPTCLQCALHTLFQLQ
jgi:hypothetical protein